MSADITISPPAQPDLKYYTVSAKRHYKLRTAADTRKRNKLDSKDPYDQYMKERFEDSYRSDGVVKRSIDTRVLAIVGKTGKTVLDTTLEFSETAQGQAEKKTMIENIQNNSLYSDAKNKIDRLNQQLAIDFHTKISSAVKQCLVYGRSAIEIVRDTNNEPIALHVLNSMKLGKVIVDQNTWMMTGVEYLELPTEDNVLKTEDIIYMAINDDCISPGSNYYGLSMLEPVIDGSETKRILKQEDLKEAAKTSWQGIGLVRFLNENTTSAEIENFMSSIKPGTWTGYKHEVEVKVETLKAEFAQMTAVIDFLNQEALRDLGIPEVLGGYGQSGANYANSQQIVAAFKSLDIDNVRVWLKNIIQQQWLSKIFYPLINQPNPNTVDFDPQVDQYPEVKLEYEFEDLNLETFVDKVNANLPLYEKGLISGESVLEAIGKDSEVESYALRDEEKKIEKEREFQLKMKEIETRQMPPRQSINPNLNNNMDMDNMKTASTANKEMRGLYSLLRKKINEL